MNEWATSSIIVWLLVIIAALLIIAYFINTVERAILEAKLRREEYREWLMSRMVK